MYGNNWINHRILGQKKLYFLIQKNLNTVPLLETNEWMIYSPTCHWQRSMPSAQASELCSCHLKKQSMRWLTSQSNIIYLKIYMS